MVLDNSRKGENILINFFSIFPYDFIMLRKTIGGAYKDAHAQTYVYNNFGRSRSTRCENVFLFSFNLFN